MGFDMVDLCAVFRGAGGLDRFDRRGGTRQVQPQRLRQHEPHREGGTFLYWSLGFGHFALCIGRCLGGEVKQFNW